MKFANKIAPTLTVALLLAGCGNRESAPSGIQAAPEAALPSVSDFPVKLGESYQIGATTYTPEDAALYDEVGYASVHGADKVGKPTANGEVFAPGAVSAAHKTLPMPSYAEVTALDTGRTILVRINDRGPFADDRLIGLSDGAARQLGVPENGVAAVRVRRVNPPEQDRAALRAGLPAAIRMDTPESLLKVLRDRLAKMPKPAAKPTQPPIAAEVLRAADEKKAAVAVASMRPAAKEAKSKPAAASAPGSYFVQVGAFASRASADALAAKLDAKVIPGGDGKLHRVRFGPFANQNEAQAALDRVRKRGYPQARMLRE